MKKFLLATVVAFASLTAWAHHGDVRVAPTLSFGTETNSFGLGAKVQYGLTSHLVSEAGFDYFMGDRSMIDINLDFAYKIGLSNSKLFVYPLAGVTFEHWDAGIDRFGINLGGGCEYQLTSRVGFFGELKGQFVKDLSQAVVTTGLRITLWGILNGY